MKFGGYSLACVKVVNIVLSMFLSDHALIFIDMLYINHRVD